MLNCPKCGISIIEGDRFCSGCGHPADHAEYLTETKNGQNKDVTIKNKRSLPSVWWLALVVVLMGLASFLYFSQDIKESIFTYTKESNQQPEDSSQQLIGISEHIYQEGVPVIIFKEDFEASKLNLWRNEIPFVNWYSINHDAAADNPGWVLHEEGGNHFLIGSRSHAVARPQVVGWSDYSINLRFKIIKLDYFNLTFRETIDSGYYRYFVNINNGGQPFQLIKQSTANASSQPLQNDFRVLTHANKSFNTNRWYTLKAVVAGNNIKIYIDDEMIFDYSDNANPFLHGKFSFEIGQNSSVLIDDIVVSRHHLENVETLLAEDDQTYIPSLQATVKALRFFEESEKANAKAVRLYNNTFFTEASRFIWWELYITCVPGRKTMLPLFAEYYGPDGEQIYSGEINGFYIDKGWNELTMAAGFGYQSTGLWAPGEYMVKLYFEGQQLAEGSFLISSDKEAIEELQSTVNADYAIDFINGTHIIGDLEIGTRLVDPSWTWEFKTGDNYTGRGYNKPVTWIVVSKDHYDGLSSHVTLLAEDPIGFFTFDNSTNRGHQYGHNHWELSGTGNATYGLRPWLNGIGIYAGDSFLDAFSDDFKANIIITSLPNIEWVNGSSYYTLDYVFVPSTTELGDILHEHTSQIGKCFQYFDAAADDIRKAQIGNTYIEYWTRSPSRVMSYSLRCVNSDGSFFIPQSYQLFNIGHAYRSHCGVRPVVNVKSSIPVSRIITRLF